MLLFIEGSLVVLSVCRAHHRLGSDARTAHFRRFHAAASSITARQENHAQWHRNRGSGTSPQLRLDPVRNDRSADDSRRPSNYYSARSWASAEYWIHFRPPTVCTILPIFVGQISRYLKTTRRSVSRWIRLEQNFENFPVRGRFSKNAKKWNLFSTSCDFRPP